MQVMSLHTFPRALQPRPQHVDGGLCPECSNPRPDIVTDMASGHVVCRDCGFVVGNRIISDEGEWRQYTESGSHLEQLRVGTETDPAASNQFAISLSARTVSGAPARRGGAGTLGRLHHKVGGPTAADKQLERGYQEVQRLGEAMGVVNRVVAQSKEIFGKAHSARHVRAPMLPAMAAACMYAACRLANAPRTIKEIESCTTASVKQIGKCYKIITDTVGLKMAALTVEDYAARVCNALGLPMEVLAAAKAVARRADELGHTLSRKPLSVGAAAVALTSQLGEPEGRRTLPEVAAVALVAESTLRPSFEALVESRVDLVTPEVEVLMREYGTSMDALAQ